MEYVSTIRAVQKTLASFTFSPTENASFSEDFAIARFKKKLQVPDPEIQQSLSEEAWTNWLEFDGSLPKLLLPPHEWVRVAAYLRKKLRPCKFSDIDFPKGSEFIPTRGANSIQSRLEHSTWTVTHDAFQDFSRIVYNHKALKRAFRHRYTTWFSRQDFDMSPREADHFLYRKFRHLGERASFAIFSWKLERIVKFVYGSRFSTVPKNNEARRPINIEPFGNILVQRSIGLHLRRELKRLFGVDLETLQDTHRQRIKDSHQATIDLKNASDAISTELVKYVIPVRLYGQIARARSEMILGPDGNFHRVNKVSSMGNGFTFELMSLLLNAVCKVLDPNATVYGDDIIICKTEAPRLIQIIEQVGFVVNKDKSFIDGPFRESCGSNYHDVEGYIESYDFLYPENIHDCIVTLNKAFILGKKYGPFRKLFHSLQRCMPPAFCSGIPAMSSDIVRNAAPDPVALSSYFRTERKATFLPSRKVQIKIQRKLRSLCYTETPKYFLGFKYVPSSRTKMKRHLKSTDWAKYELYLHSGRRSEDVLTSRGEWRTVLFVNVGEQVFQASSLLL